MDEFRTNAARAAIAFGVAAAAAVFYGVRNDSFFPAALALLTVAGVWTAMWAASRGESSTATNLESRVRLAQASWVIGLLLAVVLVIAAVFAG